MITYSYSDYAFWRNAVLLEPHGARLHSRRGDYYQLAPFIIDDYAEPGRHLKNRAIEDAEYSLIMNGTISDHKTIHKLYENDNDLLEAYQRLLICRFKSRKPSSRNNVICEPQCCLSYWQFNIDRLVVTSRSIDLQRAGLSDIIIVNRIAHELGCRRFTVVAVSPHIYINNTKIARRT